MGLKERGLTGTLLLTIFITCFGSSFILGYNVPFWTLSHWDVEHLVKDLFFDESEDLYAQEASTKRDVIFIMWVAVWMTGGAIGAFSGGWLAEGFGRRNSLLFNHLIAFVGAVVSALCLKHYSLLFLGRFILGLNCGVTTSIASMYLVEIAPTAYRGSIGACHQLAVTIGIFISYVTYLSGLLWSWGNAVNGVPAVASFIILPFCPESPRFLLVNKKNEEAAKKAFERLNAKDNVNTFITELKAEMEAAEGQPKFRFIQLFTKKDLRMAVTIACLVQIQQQFSGSILTIICSKNMFFISMLKNKMLLMCGIGLFNVALTLISLPLLERAGRRILLLWPTVLLAISLVFFNITVNLPGAFADNGVMKYFPSIAVALLMFIHVGGFALGLGPIPAMIVAEIFRQRPRAAAYSLSQGLWWISNLLVMILLVVMDFYLFIPFLIIVVVCWMFFSLYMPETKNRTFDEIAQDLSSGKTVFDKKSQS